MEEEYGGIFSADLKPNSDPSREKLHMAKGSPSIFQTTEGGTGLLVVHMARPSMAKDVNQSNCKLPKWHDMLLEISRYELQLATNIIYYFSTTKKRSKSKNKRKKNR